MTEFTIPCETFVRLNNLLAVQHENSNEWFKTIRIDDGCAVVSNRMSMAVEYIGGVSGVIHVIPHPGLLEACRKEAPFKSTLTIVVNDLLKFAVAKTQFGYTENINCVLWSDQPNDFDKWRSIIDKVRTSAKPRGAMYWNAENIAALAACSPSGRLVFEENIDAVDRPTLIRDIHDNQWIGLFNPFTNADYYQPATLPAWI